MIRKFCDKCNEEVSATPGVLVVVVDKSHNEDGRRIIDTRLKEEIDLCDPCYCNLITTIRGLIGLTK